MVVGPSSSRGEMKKTTSIPVINQASGCANNVEDGRSWSR